MPCGHAGAGDPPHLSTPAISSLFALTPPLHLSSASLSPRKVLQPLPWNPHLRIAAEKLGTKESSSILMPRLAGHKRGRSWWGIVILKRIFAGFPLSAWTEGDPRSQTQACQSVKGAPQRYTDWKRCTTEVQRLEKVQHKRYKSYRD